MISRPAAEAAGLDVTGRELLQAPVKGRSEKVEFYVLKTLEEMGS